MHRQARMTYRAVHPRSAGFTLIEILVVVAIIALLVAILLPSLARARWQTRVVACRAHMHDLGTAFTVYTETYKGYFPVTPNNTSDSFWSLYKARLLPDVKVLICPASRNVIRPHTLQAPPKMVSSQENGRPIPVGQSDIDVTAKERDDSSGGHSYEYNALYDPEENLPAAQRHPMAGRHKKTTHFKMAFHDMMLVHDNDNRDPNFANGFVGCEGSLDSDKYPYSIGNNCPQPWDNHGSEGMNMLFADGHSQMVPKTRGEVVDRRADPPKTFKSPNAPIDKVWLKSQWPWHYSR
ncbi:MAG TPA: prepilin-type N-terminal cleavage/methylation domain-containing protein [Phycisphaerae bacterium]|nr:prepilin-type N-terminal cleavage/methylation domain-containing protein [Phycisphaerae bacterium]